MESSNRGWIEGLKSKTITAQNHVREHMSTPELYRKTAEAAADLAQACLKYARALEGDDSVNYYLRFKQVIDVYAELMNTAEIAGIPQDVEAKAVKAQRWADQLSDGQEEKQTVSPAEKQKLDEEAEELLRPFFPDLEEAKDSSTGIRTRTFFPEEDEEVTEKCSQ